MWSLALCIFSTSISSRYLRNCPFTTTVRATEITQRDLLRYFSHSPSSVLTKVPTVVIHGFLVGDTVIRTVFCSQLWQQSESYLVDCGDSWKSRWEGRRGGSQGGSRAGWRGVGWTGEEGFEVHSREVDLIGFGTSSQGQGRGADAGVFGLGNSVMSGY